MRSSPALLSAPRSRPQPLALRCCARGARYCPRTPRLSAAQERGVVAPRWLLAGAEPSQGLGSAARRNCNLWSLSRSSSPRAAAPSRVASPRAAPSAGAGSAAGSAVATFSNGSALATALSPAAAAGASPAALLRARRAVRFADAATASSSVVSGWRSTLAGPWFGRTQELAVRGLRLAHLLLAPLLLHALLLFAPHCHWAGAGSAAFSAVATFPQKFCSRRRALASSNGRGRSCCADARATRGPVRGRSACQLRRSKVWWLLGGFRSGRSPRSRGPAAQKNSQFAVSVSLVFSFNGACAAVSAALPASSMAFWSSSKTTRASPGIMSQPNSRSCLSSRNRSSPSGVALASFSQCYALGAAPSPTAMAAASPAALLRARRAVRSAVTASANCAGVKCGGSLVASGWGGALVWHWFAVSVSLVFSSRRCSFLRGFSSRCVALRLALEAQPARLLLPFPKALLSTPHFRQQQWLQRLSAAQGRGLVAPRWLPAGAFPWQDTLKYTLLI